MKVLLAFGVELLVVLVIAKSADGLIVKVAVTKLGLAPTEVLSEPAGMVLAASGETIEVTTTEIEQLALGATTVLIGADRSVPPPVAMGAGPEQVLATAGTAALNKPAG